MRWLPIAGYVLLCALSIDGGLAASPGIDEGPEDPDDEKGDESPCRLIDHSDPKAIDHVRGMVHRTVCATARWFDDLFGDPRAFEESEQTYGVLEAGGDWEDGEGTDVIGRARIKWRFPAMQRRLKLILGRLPDERISREEEDPDGIAEPLDPDEQDWVAGLEAAPVDTTRHRLNVGVGATYGDSLEPYVKVRSRLRWFPGEQTALSLRLTPYWQDGDRDYGARASIDLDHTLGPKLIQRWTATGIHDGSTDGTRYVVGTVLYHQINETYFMMHRANVRGETKAEVPDANYGFVSSLRRSVYREWLFVELGVGVDWRRESLAVDREPVGLAKVVMAMHFGEKR